jgi:hypothetical protein
MQAGRDDDTGWDKGEDRFVLPNPQNKRSIVIIPMVLLIGETVKHPDCANQGAFASSPLLSWDIACTAFLHSP